MGTVYTRTSGEVVTPVVGGTRTHPGTVSDGPNIPNVPRHPRHSRRRERSKCGTTGGVSVSLEESQRVCGVRVRLKGPVDGHEDEDGPSKIGGSGRVPTGKSRKDEVFPWTEESLRKEWDGETIPGRE